MRLLITCIALAACANREPRPAAPVAAPAPIATPVPAPASASPPAAIEPAPPRPIVLEGRVADPADKPIAGADVALLSGGIRARVRSDSEGKFRFDAPPGRWGFSAWRAGYVGSFINARPFDGDAGDIKLVLGTADGVVVRGKASPGLLSPDAYVEISLVSSNNADVFAVPFAADGAFEASLPRSDDYAAQLKGGIGGYALGKRTGARADLALKLIPLVPPPQEVVDWIAAHAIPLATAEPGRGLDDLAPIARLIGQARVVGLGEASHGTREFFQLKHRLLEYLVARQGFTVFAIEANQPECRAINEYVLHGTGDPKAGLEGLHVWPWKTEEVLAMIEWMRAWNADPAHRNKIQFVGYDMQFSHAAFAALAAFLNKVAPDAAAGLLAPIALLDTPKAYQAVTGASEERRGQLAAGLAAIANAFDAGGQAWAKATSSRALAETRHDLTILEQAVALFVAGERSLAVRDQAMAANLQWILDHQPAGARMVVWAHNAHIANYFGETNPTPSMGGHLRKRFKAGYVNIGFVFSHGAFQAMQANGARFALNEITLDPPPAWDGSVAFARTGKPLLALDLHALPRRGAVHDWFLAPHPMRQAEAVFTTEDKLTLPMILPASFDAVIFVDKTTPSRPLTPRT